MIGHRYLLGAAALAIAAPAAAQPQDSRRSYRIEAQDLGAALRAFSIASGRDVIADAAIVEDKRSARLTGDYDPQTALARLLRRTGLRAELVDGGFVIRPMALPGAEGNAPDIVVVGTRIRGVAPTGAPVMVVDRTDVERSGRATVQGLFETIPANFSGGLNEAVAGTTSRNNAGDNAALGSSINLRGLGPSSTLVLFDGNRPALGGVNGTFADVSLIPQLAIERIEILTDGASAVYGSDAVAGVVNFRFRSRFSGFESYARAGTADGDFGEYQLGQLAGARWDSGGVTLAYQFTDRGNLSGSERDYATDDLRPFGGGDFRSLFTTPGTIIAANGAIFGIPAGQDGRALRADQLIPGQVSRRDVRKETDLLARQRSHAVFAGLDQDVTDGIGLYLRGLWARRDYRFNRTLLPEAVVRVPVTNAFYVDPIGTRQPVQVRYDFGRDFGREYRTGGAEGLTATAGVTADLGSWRAELVGSYGRQVERQNVLNSVNTFRLAAALADSNPATAYNVFGDGMDTNPATVDRIRGGRRVRTRSEVWSTSLRAEGPLFALPAGDVRLALGAEHRDERLGTVITSDLRGAAPAVSNLLGLPARRNVDAIYGELLVPLAADGAGWIPGKLDLSAAVRHERYSDFGQTTNPKFGVSWEPVAGLRLRGSYGTSFRAPGFGDLVGPAFNLYQTLDLADPMSPTGRSVAIGLFGYSDDIGPETAESWTAGFDLTDWPIKGLNATLSYFDIDYRDRIATPTADFLNFLTRRDLYGALVDENPDPALVARYFADPGFFNPLGVAPGQVDVIVDALLRNLSSTRIRGLDGDIEFARPLFAGTATLGLAGTYYFEIGQKVTSGARGVDFASVLGNPVRLRLRGRLLWSRGPFDAGLFVNRVGSYRNQTVTPAERVDPWTTVDLSLGYRFESGAARGLRLALTAANLFDTDPPFVTNRSFDSTLGFDPEQASPVGRMIAAQATVKW